MATLKKLKKCMAGVVIYKTANIQVATRVWKFKLPHSIRTINLYNMLCPFKMNREQNS